MSTPRHRTSPAPARQATMCMCATGESCTSFAPGHALHLIQARLVSATPSEWVDVVVVSVESDGSITIADWHSGDLSTLWSGAGAAEAVSAGEPATFHPRYHVLAVGGERYNVLDVS